MPFEPPPIPLCVLWLIWVAQAAWCVFNLYSFHDRLKRWDRRIGARVEHRGPFTPFAAVIVPIKGADEHLRDHVMALKQQDYPAFRLIFVVESQQDPAFAALKQVLADDSSGPPTQLLVAGAVPGGGQKVHNLCCGVESLNETDTAVVFADVDAAPDDQWLRLVVDRLYPDHIGAATGYRWLIPARDEPNLPTRLGCVLNAAVATLLGPPWRSHAWGGSMSIRRQTIIDAKLLDHWRGALSDDYQLTRAVKSIGKQVFFVPRLLIRSPVNYTWRSLWEFARRQYLITRIYAPLIWLAALLGAWIYTAGWIAAIIAAIGGVHGWGWGLAAWGIVWFGDFVRSALRRSLVKKVFTADTVQRLSGVFSLDRWATPLWMALLGLIVLSSAVGRTIRWAGITYRLRGRQAVDILHRPAAKARAEAGVDPA